MKQWDSAWPASRLETHFDGRVVRCFIERPKSLHAMLDNAVLRNPDGDAMVCGTERITWKDLLDISARLATGLERHGIGPGDRVAMLIGNRNEFVITLFAIARLGAIAVPLSVREQTPGLAYMLNDCSASLIVHEAELGERLPVSAEVPSLKTRVSIGYCSGSEEFSTLITGSPSGGSTKVKEEDVVAIMYTSGTTGKPKGAALTHLGIVHSGMHLQIAMGLTNRDTAVASVPLSHVTGLIALIATMVQCAGKLVIMPSFKATDFLALAASERMTYTLMVPAMYNLCLLQPDFDRHDISAWRVGGYGGAPMPVATISSLAQKIPSLTLMNCYGSTETTSPSTLMPQGETADHNDTVGRALACVEIAVFDESGCEVEAGALGEIWIKGPMVVKGYWNNPTATADNFTGGFWHSGDIGSIGSDGYIKIADRMKDMINRGGYKIFTIEVENVLYQHPAVLECAVVAKPCPVLGERVHAFVTLRHSDISAEALPGVLMAYCAARLSDYKVPESFTLSESPLPRNANGKLLKRALRDQASALLPAPKAIKNDSVGPR
ncbi:class I adenylate-forming enzyme family protein [Glaciimonas sp. PAMC28666]|uniref:class I adenylate-forming enzyme family protein n=1 Tax=Glaciimonas sp. PAMC28666 TaxID=2807626 RepID=UPI0019646EAA|nr:class I adenylate-forming enzyme family protein [Glaciimonas sp. PAMC28666]QRX83595.1 acyl--CoA ligase [Glaciimonas sp. PAMC28666]